MAELPPPLPPPSLRDRVVGWQQRADGPHAGTVTIAAVVLAVAVVSVGATYLISNAVGNGRNRDVALTLPRADREPAAPGAGGSSSSSTVGAQMHVHAAGAVLQPGVVSVRAGARVTDVVAAAGGAAADADLDQVNLAAPVSDGERVYIPRKGEAAVPVSSGGGGGAGSKSAGGEVMVNINTADQATLETLPGVGPSTAQAIIEYRTRNGRFKNVDELLNVRGIGPSKLSQIRPHARV